MRVKYNEFSNVVPDDLDPAAIFNTLKNTFPELSNGTYEVVQENGEKTMKVSVRGGSKA